MHRTTAELEALEPVLREAPKDEGAVSLVVRRPSPGEREVLAEAELSTELGLVGDSWHKRVKGTETKHGNPVSDTMLNVMSARMVGFLADTAEGQALAGDQLYLDLDLSVENLPAGTRLALGTAVIEVTSEPHAGCSKFIARFGVEAMKFVNSRLGRELRLRGFNARVVTAGVVCTGDTVSKLA